MRTNVTFRHPMEFVSVAGDDGILAVAGAHWFASLLRRVPELQVDDELCQEDWGVVIFCRREQKRFWVGLSRWPEGREAWLSHFHQGAFAWLRGFQSAREMALKRLISDVHAVLVSEPPVSKIRWYEECEMTKASPAGFATPDT